VAKTRVSELAKEYGITSKEAISLLGELGEFVKTASSSVELPAVMKFKKAYGDDLLAKQASAGAAPAAADAPAPAASGSPSDAASDSGTQAAAPTPAPTPAPAAAPAKPAGPRPGPRPGPKAPAAEPTPEPAPVVETQPEPVVESKPEPPAATATGCCLAPDGSPKPPAPRPVGRPGAPRPGNNPFASSPGYGSAARHRSSGEDRRAPRPPAAREGGAPGRPGMPRPNPAMMPKSPAAFGTGPGRPPRLVGGADSWPSVALPGAAAPGSSRCRWRVRVLPAAPGFAPADPGGPVLAAVAPAVAVVVPVSVVRPRVPSVGETVRLARGSSLTDFAEKINVDPASLVQMLFSLGEMVTATQSVNDETFEPAGRGAQLQVEVVSPEDEDRELLESFDLEFGEDEGDERRGPRGASAGRDRHGSRRPRKDQAARRDPQRQRGRG
jgi:translation initiation factor IF-2